MHQIQCCNGADLNAMLRISRQTKNGLRYALITVLEENVVKVSMTETELVVFIGIIFKVDEMKR